MMPSNTIKTRSGFVPPPLSFQKYILCLQIKLAQPLTQDGWTANLIKIQFIFSLLTIPLKKTIYSPSILTHLSHRETSFFVIIPTLNNIAFNYKQIIRASLFIIFLKIKKNMMHLSSKQAMSLLL